MSLPPLIPKAEPASEDTPFDDDDLFEDDDQDDELDDDDEDKFVVPGSLSAPDEMKITTHKLHEDIVDGLIDLCPEYQRDVVWSNAKQSLLIDSLLRDLYVPPIVFAKSFNEELGEELRICIDGKQRLTSIQKFMDGLISWRHPDGKVYWYNVPSNHALSRLELPPAGKRLFNSKLIRCIEFNNLAPMMEREVFQRVQLGMSLTAAEKLQAIASPWARWISTLEQRHVLVEDGLDSILHWNITRGRTFQNLSQMIYIIEGLPAQTLPTTQKLEKWVSRPDHPTRQLQERVDKVLRTIWLIANGRESDDADNRAMSPFLGHSSPSGKVKPKIAQAFKLKQVLAPIEFVFMGVLVYRLLYDLPTHSSSSRQPRPPSFAVIGEALLSLRTHVRQDFRDIRANSVVGKALFTVIDQICRSIASSSNPPPLPRAASSKKRGLPPVDEDYAPARAKRRV